VKNKTIFENDLLYYFLLIIFSLYSLLPIIINPTGAIVAYGDSLLITSIINQNISKIPFNLQNVFQGSIFYPIKDTVAFSDVFLPSSFIAYPFVHIFNSPVLGFNVNLIFSQLLTAIITYLFLKDLTKDKLASFVGSSALIFSQIRINFSGYLQMWNMQWYLGSSYLFFKYLNTRQQRYLYLCALVGIIQMWESPLGIFFIFFTCLIMSIPHFKIILKRFKEFILPALLFLTFSLPLILKYYDVSRTFGIVRSIRETSNFSMSINDLWKALFCPGLYLVLAFSLNNVVIKRLIRLKIFYVFAGLFIFSLLMALGPVLKFDGHTVKLFQKIFIPLPYGVFYYLIPGFNGLRTPLRFIFLFAFSLSTLIAFSISQIHSTNKKILIVLFLIFIILGGSRVKKVLSIPPPTNSKYAYQFLELLPGKTTIELPMYSWVNGDSFQKEFIRMYFIYYHRKYLVNGASGFNPPEWDKLQMYLWQNFPNRESVEKLSEIGVNYILVHKDEYSSQKNQEIKENKTLKLIWEDEQNSIYQ
jgi:hypothetical protein